MAEYDEDVSSVLSLSQVLGLEYNENASSVLVLAQDFTEQYIANQTIAHSLSFVHFGEVGDKYERIDATTNFELQQTLMYYVNNPNIYGTVEGGDNYFANRLSGKKWRSSTSLDRKLGLGEATFLIDRLNFLGFKSDTNQKLQFPRGIDTIVPDDIIFATYELALRLLQGVDPELEAENLQVINRLYATTGVTYNRSGVPEHVLAGIPSVRAWSLLKPYLRDPATIIMSRVT